MSHETRAARQVQMVVLLTCLMAMFLQGCALFDAFSGDASEDPADVSGLLDVGVDVGTSDSGTKLEPDVSDVGDGPDIVEVFKKSVCPVVEGQTNIGCAAHCVCGCKASDDEGMECIDTIASISVGAYHICALSKGELKYCWGNNDFWQLGQEGDSSETPQRTMAGGSIKAVSAGGITFVCDLWSSG